MFVFGETAKGLIINNTSTTTFSGGTLQLGSDGITVAATAAPPVFNSSVSVELEASQNWNNGSTLCCNETGSNVLKHRKSDHD